MSPDAQAHVAEQATGDQCGRSCRWHVRGQNGMRLEGFGRTKGGHQPERRPEKVNCGEGAAEDNAGTCWNDDIAVRRLEIGRRT